MFQKRAFHINVVIFSWLILNAVALEVSSNENEDEYLSQKDNVLEESYHGLIRENETLVEITPLIKVDEEKICGFRILKRPFHEIPFQIELVNDIGILKARYILNCENRKNYQFKIVGVFCDGTHSASANVHITVIDINEYAPTFLQPSYVTEVDEGRLYKEIIRVEAIDKDCTPLFGDVCKFDILNHDQPFVIDNEGSIRNTEPLSHKVSHNYILSVVAYDCSMKVSAPIMVSIKVRRVCETRFLGIPERIDYTTAESLILFPNAHLELCEMYCDNQNLNIRTSIALKTKHISFGCDRGISNCSASKSLINLLPKDADWTKNLSFDEGSEPIFHFDGSSGVIVPNSVATHHDFASQSFSIVTIFRHTNLAAAGNKHLKEHIICSADDHKMNRHHMALFVRNCRLILLLRKNFNDGDLNIFSPAEWRWKIPQVCDNEWHHYVVNVDQFQKVQLYIDGARFENLSEDAASNPEVIDDWPLHAAHGVNSTLSIGACYQSSENRLKHAFNGDISQIKVLTNGVLSSEEIKCGTSCAEHLLPPAENLLEAYSQVQANAPLNQIYIEAQSKATIEKLLQQVKYINTKQSPTIGRRNIEIRTSIMCVNQSAIRLPVIETYIMVNEPAPLASIIAENGSENSILPGKALPASKTNSNVQSLPQKVHSTSDVASNKILISGDKNILVTYMEIKSGVKFLNNIMIRIVKRKEVLSDIQKLDSCSILVFPSLNPDHEDIQLNGDETLSATLDTKININKEGIDIVGSDSVANYLNILKALVYSNKKPAYYLNRVFKLSCTQLNSQYKMAEFTLTLTVLHPKQFSARSTALAIAQENDTNSGIKLEFERNVEDHKLISHAMVQKHDAEEPQLKIHSIIHEAKTSHPIALVLLSLLIVVLVCGFFIARYKNKGKTGADQHQPCPKIGDESLIWDDSALTITINPMQADSVSDESSDSENSDSDEEEVKGKFTTVNQLEWDNSNIFTPTVN